MTKSPPSISVETVVICDDIRREDNGKVILIGVYNNVIILERYPAVIQPKFWLQCKASADGNVPLKMRIIANKKQKLYEAKADIDVERGQFGFFAFGLHSPPIKLASPCSLTLKFQQPGKRWQTITEFVVAKGP